MTGTAQTTARGIALVALVALLLAACGPFRLPIDSTAPAATATPQAAARAAARATPSRSARHAAPSAAHATPAARATATPAPARVGVTPTAIRPPATPAPARAATSARAYFVQDGRLVAEPVDVPDARSARSSVEALLAGPRVAGHQTQVPQGTRLLGLSVAGGTATLDLSDQARRVQGSPAIPLFLGQVVYTLTELPSVQRVVVRVAGQEVRVLGGEGVAVPEPLDRAAVQRLLK